MAGHGRGRPLRPHNLREDPKVLAWSLLCILAMITAILAIGSCFGVETAELFRDPAGITRERGGEHYTESPSFLGLASQVGVLLWAASVAVCVFSFSLLRGSGRGAEAAPLFLYGGMLGVLLLFDDLLLLHEDVYPRLLGIREAWVFALYAGLLAAFLLSCRRVITAAPFLLLVIAVACFAISVAVDLAAPGLKALGMTRLSRLVLEDLPKLVGVAAWLAYFAVRAHRELRPREAR